DDDGIDGQHLREKEQVDGHLGDEGYDTYGPQLMQGDQSPWYGQLPAVPGVAGGVFEVVEDPDQQEQGEGREHPHQKMRPGDETLGSPRKARIGYRREAES